MKNLPREIGMWRSSHWAETCVEYEPIQQPAQGALRVIADVIRGEVKWFAMYTTRTRRFQLGPHDAAWKAYREVLKLCDDIRVELPLELKENIWIELKLEVNP